MTPLEDLKEKFRSLPGALPGIMKEIFIQIRSVVEDLNIEQLDRGERPDGSILPNYSPVSVRFFGKRPGPMNLHDKGPFWQGITLVVTNDGVELEGRDIKTEMLQLRYGQVIGLQEQSKEQIESDYLQPEIEEKLTNNYFNK